MEGFKLGLRCFWFVREYLLNFWFESMMGILIDWLFEVVIKNYKWFFVIEELLFFLFGCNVYDGYFVLNIDVYIILRDMMLCMM